MSVMLRSATGKRNKRNRFTSIDSYKENKRLEILESEIR